MNKPIHDIQQPQPSAKSAPFTVKIQKPLMQGDGLLVFNRDKSIHRSIPARGPLLAQFKETERKAFFRARFAGDGVSLEIAERVPDEAW